MMSKRPEENFPKNRMGYTLHLIYTIEKIFFDANSLMILLHSGNNSIFCSFSFILDEARLVHCRGEAFAGMRRSSHLHMGTTPSGQVRKRRWVEMEKGCHMRVERCRGRQPPNSAAQHSDINVGQEA